MHFHKVQIKTLTAANIHSLIISQKSNLKSFISPLLCRYHTQSLSFLTSMSFVSFPLPSLPIDVTHYCIAQQSFIMLPLSLPAPYPLFIFEFSPSIHLHLFSILLLCLCMSLICALSLSLYVPVFLSLPSCHPLQHLFFPSHAPWQQAAVLVTLVAQCSRRTGGRPHPASLLHPSTGLQGWHAK